MTIDVTTPFIVVAPPRTRVPPATAWRTPPPPPPLRRRDVLLNRVVASQSLWLAPILILQAVLCLRLDNGMSDDEALEINSGHQMIAYLLHGTPAPAFGRYFDGMPAFYAVPAAMLDHLDGLTAVRGANALLMLLATVLVYLAARRAFGQGAALIAGATFAVNPATIVAARFASVDALCVATLAAALYTGSKATQRGGYGVATGALLAVAVAAKYAALLFLPGALLVVVFVGIQRTGLRRALRAVMATSGVAVITMATFAVVGRHDVRGFTATVLGGHESLSGSAGLHAAWTCIGLMAIAGVAAAIATGRRRPVAVVLCAAALVPLAVDIASGGVASVERNAALAMVFLAPLLGAGGALLVRQGRHLGLRAPLALVAAVVLLSSGMATSARMFDGWPRSTSIDAALRAYTHEGTDRYLVDGSDLPAYYLSNVTHYDQWESTLQARYAGPGGEVRLHQDLQNAAYDLVLYRGDGATPGLDASMLATLRTRYTLVARIPVSPSHPTAYWNLWLAELPG